MHKIHVAIVVNSLPPYRIHQHLKIAGMSDVRLSTIRLEETTRDRWDPVVPDDINSVDMTNKAVNGILGVLTGLQLVRWIRKHQVDVVIVNGYALEAYRTLQVACFLIGIPCCLWGDSNIHGDLNTGLKSVIKSRVLKWYLKTAKLCLPCGSAGTDYFRKYEVPSDKLHVFSLEPDCESIISLSGKDIKLTLSRFTMRLKRRRIVFSGRFIEKKHPEIALKCFCEIAHKYSDWDFVLVGDGPLKKELMHQVPADLRGRVFFTGFLTEQKQVSAIYRASDVLLHPADYEPWALVIHEAVAAGMAIVASEVVGAAIDLVEDGRNGFRCPVGNISSFVEALEKCIFNIEEFKAASIKINYDWLKANGTVPSLRRLIAKLGLYTDEN